MLLISEAVRKLLLEELHRDALEPVCKPSLWNEPVKDFGVIIEIHPISKKTWQQKAWVQQGVTDQRALQMSSLGSRGNPTAFALPGLGLKNNLRESEHDCVRSGVGRADSRPWGSRTNPIQRNSQGRLLPMKSSRRPLTPRKASASSHLSLT